MLAGGAGSRLDPVTRAVCKQLLPVYDKPMIYYPLSVLMLAGVRDVLVITTPQDQDQFTRLLGDGSQWGLSLTYATQPSPDGLAQALVIGADHIGRDDVALVLGDNIFFGHGLSGSLRAAAGSIRDERGCVLFGYRVTDPERYGVAEVDASGKLLGIEEKPQQPRSNLAVTGLYLYDNDASAIARDVQPSARGEYEITDVNRAYIDRGTASLVDLGRGTAWLDTGTQDSLLAAGQFVQVLQQRQGITIACLEEIAVRQGYIDADTALAAADAMGASQYAAYLRQVARDLASTA